MPILNEFKGNIDALAFAVVRDSENRIIPMSRFWNQNSVLFVFLRHFGCISCRSHAHEIWEQCERLQKNGTKIVFIGSGTPDRIEEFRTTYNLNGASIFVDPTLQTYKLAGFHHGLSYLLKMESAKNMAKLAMEGHTNGNPFSKGTGSNLQMGGILVVHPGPKVSYHYVSEAVGDTPEVETLLEEKSEDKKSP